ncbi:hypothetical protein M758_3G166500 [Ceratodon purpureus]|uniref:Lycopene epsilon-cyclase n=1 Tax=Ceratodon purpureus TaxID=3225 RepID=A0A8T0IJ93_CERPU|nr:hypothetical protein KC19_3G166800 [Ceratodon purpureus]KAG0623340.1 hypothetical protein M758_3G166500 [Ceratodon purpureus]
MGAAVPGLQSSSPALVREPFAAVASCVCSGRNWLRLPLRRGDGGGSYGVKWIGRAGRERYCPPVCSSATVPTRLWDGVAEDREDYIKAGGEELDLVQLQASKTFEQPKIAERLQPLSDETLDLVVIGCGPAGMCLAAEAAKQGLNVGLVGPDLPFVNNYGVWTDEFAALGLEDCIEQTWGDSAMYIEGDSPIMIGRAYGRVSRTLLREELVRRCAEAGVGYLDSRVDRISEVNEGLSSVLCTSGRTVKSRLVTVASGAAAGRFLRYEPGGPEVSVQTAYGLEVEVEHYPYNADHMLFMDYRDYRCRDPESVDSEEIPTFLYAMPVSSTRVFFEETCLAARPAMSFGLLRDRLHERLEKMGIKILHVHEEEWSYIPVGVNLPMTTQRQLGFGAAASMVHPATGYSVVRSLSEAPLYAAAIARALRVSGGKATSSNSQEAAIEAWNVLWSGERKRQRAFFMFGLELILQLDTPGIKDFFVTFFQLPEWLWKGFLGSKLSSVDLIWFALATFVIAPNALRFKLVKHLLVDPSGAKLVQSYTGFGGGGGVVSSKSTDLKSVKGI